MLSKKAFFRKEDAEECRDGITKEKVRLVGGAWVVVPLFAFAVAFALCADVVAQHCAQNEVFLGRELAEWARHHHSNGVHALAFAKEEVYPAVANGLNNVFDALAFKAVDGIIAVLFVECVQHHLPDPFLVLIDMVHEYFHIAYRHYLFLLHSVYSFVGDKVF